ncbi:MFS transporter [Embleya sp. NPDC050154]|uniref:MFS transporter n=1 Tax=Embleya sp. NPDC050154 TaxID=3363988 RepID=UPI0037A76DB2
MCVALMAVIASVSGLNVAQPDLAVEFDASQGTILWIIDIYTLSLAALLQPLGAVGDRLGRKPTLVAGLILFGLAGAAAGRGSPSVSPGAAVRGIAPAGGTSSRRSRPIIRTMRRAPRRRPDHGERACRSDLFRLAPGTKRPRVEHSSRCRPPGCEGVSSCA